jgi:hypothetical protein
MTSSLVQTVALNCGSSRASKHAAAAATPLLLLLLPPLLRAPDSPCSCVTCSKLCGNSVSCVQPESSANVRKLGSCSGTLPLLSSSRFSRVFPVTRSSCLLLSTHACISGHMLLRSDACYARSALRYTWASPAVEKYECRRILS